MAKALRLNPTADREVCRDEALPTVVFDGLAGLLLEAELLGVMVLLGAGVELDLGTELELGVGVTE